MSEETPKDSPALVHDSEEDIERRRSKNRVNAKRSRERKRLVLDTLQQDYWKLQQANKRIKTDNEKLREAIKALKDMKARKIDPKPSVASVSTSLPAMLAASPSALQPAAAAAVVGASSQSSASGTNPIVELLAQQILLQETQARMQLRAMGLPLQGLNLAQGMQHVQRTVTPELPIDGLLAQGIDPATLARLLQAHGAVPTSAGP